MTVCTTLCGYRQISAEDRRLCQAPWSWKLHVVVSYKLQNPNCASSTVYLTLSSSWFWLHPAWFSSYLRTTMYTYNWSSGVIVIQHGSRALGYTCMTWIFGTKLGVSETAERTLNLSHLWSLQAWFFMQSQHLGLKHLSKPLKDLRRWAISIRISSSFMTSLEIIKAKHCSTIYT